MTPNNSLITFLRSNTFAVWIAIASMIVQSFHTFYAFYRVSSLNGTWWGVAQACLFAAIVDAAVLFYTVRKNVKVTWMAAFIMVLINLYVYYIHLGLTFDFILGCIISFVIPVSNYFYSEEIEIDEEPKGIDVAAYKEIDDLKTAISMRDERIAKQYDIINDLKIKSETMNHSGDAIKYAIDSTISRVNPPKPKGFADLKSPAQETDKTLLGVEKVIATDRPNP